MDTNSFDRPFEASEDTNIDSAYKVIFSMFAKLVPDLPPDLYTRFREASFPVSFKRDQVILDYGQVSRHVYLTFSGLVRLTRILEGRGETTVMFLTGGDILISPGSFFTQTRSIVKLTALTDIFCIALPWLALQALYHEFTELNVVARLLTEQYYRQALDRLSWFYESPELRYEYALKAYPDLAQHVSVKELASYLGMAPETLSRVRHRIARKGKDTKR
jgi:CRP/FNR family transcriptional regulator, anaerobic regulatory protein